MYTIPKGGSMGLLDTSELMAAISREDQRRDAYVEDVISRLRDDDALEVPIEFTDLEVWSNYMNEDMYELDIKVREFLKKTRYKRQAKDGYRTTASAVFAWIYGRQPEAGDGAVCRLLHELLKYYCTSYTGKTTFHGKPVNRVYRFSKFATNSKRPYSLRLRMEEMREDADIFRASPDSKIDKRTHARRANRENGKRKAE
jgi:hypothetical protein